MIAFKFPFAYFFGNSERKGSLFSILARHRHLEEKREGKEKGRKEGRDREKKGRRK